MFNVCWQCTRVYTHACRHAYTHTYANVYAHVYTHVRHMPDTCLHTCVHAHVDAHVGAAGIYKQRMRHFPTPTALLQFLVEYAPSIILKTSKHFINIP